MTQALNWDSRSYKYFFMEVQNKLTSIYNSPAVSIHCVWPVFHFVSLILRLVIPGLFFHNTNVWNIKLGLSDAFSFISTSFYSSFSSLFFFPFQLLVSFSPSRLFYSSFLSFSFFCFWSFTFPSSASLSSYSSSYSFLPLALSSLSFNFFSSAFLSFYSSFLSFSFLWYWFFIFPSTSFLSSYSSPSSFLFFSLSFSFPSSPSLASRSSSSFFLFLLLSVPYFAFLVLSFFSFFCFLSFIFYTSSSPSSHSSSFSSSSS